jgi:thioester reductase-like protein
MKQNKELAYTARQNKESKYVLENDMEIYKNNVLKYEDVDVETKNNYQHILLTGATGFLGIHLLHDLLTNSQYELYLLVRGNTKSDAEKRLEELYKYYFGNGFNSVKERVHIINGDLAKDNFGVSKEEYNKLSDTIDCIINSAANIKHYGLAEDFYSINTDGVKRLIEFSLKGNKKDIHQISTGGVAALAERTDYYLFTEYVDELECKLNNIYLKSKYEAERLIIQAREKGINGNIYRVGEIFYNKRTKKCQKKYEEIGIYRLIKSFIQLGVIPNDKNKYMDFSFVDYVSEAITLIFDKKNILNETFHLYNSNYICLDELGDFLVEEGINLNRLEFSTFYETLFQENGDIEINNDLLAILLFLHPSRMLTLLQCGKTTKILEKFNFKWPVVQQDDIHTMMEIFKQIEFI